MTATLSCTGHTLADESVRRVPWDDAVKQMLRSERHASRSDQGNAAGRRARRQGGPGTVHFVYGLGGELLGEYKECWVNWAAAVPCEPKERVYFAGRPVLSAQVPRPTISSGSEFRHRV